MSEMKKGPRASSQPAPSASSTRYETSQMNADPKGKSWRERLASDEIGIKLLEDLDAKSRANVLSRSSSSSASSYKPRHKIQIYDTKRRKSCRSISPYMCEIARKTEAKMGSKEIYVTDAEFQLIQHALNIQTAARRKALQVRKTLFGYVYVQPAEKTADMPTKPIPMTQNSDKVSPARKSLSQTAQESESVTRMKRSHGANSMKKTRKAWNHNPFSQLKSPIQAKKPALKASGTKENVCRTGSHCSSKLNDSRWTQVNELLQLLETGSSPFETSRETLTEDLQTDRVAVDRSFSCNLIENRDLEDASGVKNPYANADDMKIALFAAAETSMILMNTLFKDSLNDPNSAQQAIHSKLFRKFVDVGTEREALGEAAGLFEDASRAIKRYLQSTTGKLTDSDESLATMHYAVVKVNADEAGTIESNDQGSRILMEDKTEEVDLETCPRPNWNYCTDFDKKPFHVTMSSSSIPGFLIQTIMCKDYEFTLQYIGNTRKVSTLVSSSSARSKAIRLTPYQLLDIIDRSFAATAARLSASKYYLQLASQDLGLVVQDYMEGKHGHYSKTIKRSNLKLQSLNTFSGVILQLSRVISNIFRALLVASDIFYHLSRILHKPPDQVKAEIKDEPKNELIEEIIGFIGEIENAVEIGKMSLASIYSTANNSELKMKKPLRNIIEHTFESISQLQTQHDKDFAALVISGICSAIMLISSKDTLPNFDPTIKRNVLSSLNIIEVNLKDMNSIANRMTFVGNYLANKSLQNLRSNREAVRMMEEKKAELRKVPWYKRRFFQRVLERTFSRISVPSPGQGHIQQTASSTEGEGDSFLSSNMSASGDDRAGNKI